MSFKMLSGCILSPSASTFIPFRIAAASPRTRREHFFTYFP
ncbi:MULTISPECIES: hypothetical protein [unclassified Variovorax]|nr:MULTISPECIES: hypothetical protein [unclassified Variovorax]